MIIAYCKTKAESVILDKLKERGRNIHLHQLVVEFYCGFKPKDCQDLNLKMREAGWKGFKLDGKVFKMASSVFAI